MNETGGLHPCPFCSSKEIRMDQMVALWAECTDCRAQGPAGSTYAEAVALWNQRADSAELGPLRELWQALGGIYESNTMIVPACLDDPIWVAFTTAWDKCDNVMRRREEGQ